MTLRQFNVGDFVKYNPAGIIWQLNANAVYVVTNTVGYDNLYVQLAALPTLEPVVRSILGAHEVSWFSIEDLMHV